MSFSLLFTSFILLHLPTLTIFLRKNIQDGAMLNDKKTGSSKNRCYVVQGKKLARWVAIKILRAK